MSLPLRPGGPSADAVHEAIRPWEDDVTQSGRAARPGTVLAVLTYRRTELLPALLDELVTQAGSVEPRAVVLVVDNDPDAGAAAVVGEWSGRGVTYVHEPRPGISAARNRALDEAGDADLLVFVDDDELPAAGWLAALTGAWRTWGCAAVAGPVPARLMGPADPWVLGSGMFDRVRHPSGQVLRAAGAGNLLLDLRRVRALGLTFDERFGLTGGEDSLFTRQLVRAGEQIRWCDEAEAVEFIPADRLTRDWVLRRHFRTGTAYSRVELTLAGSATARWGRRGVLLTKAAGRGVLAAGHWLAAAARADLAGRARARCTLAGYAGLLVGAFGHLHEEYARTSDAAVAAAAEEPTRVAAG
jgi:GT2 family glycosyltransferase